MEEEVDGQERQAEHSACDAGVCLIVDPSPDSRHSVSGTDGFCCAGRGDAGYFSPPCVFCCRRQAKDIYFPLSSLLMQQHARV